jgi:hypothetical protein
MDLPQSWIGKALRERRRPFSERSPRLLIPNPEKKQLCKCIGGCYLHPDPEKEDLRQEIGKIGEADTVLLRGDDPFGGALAGKAPESFKVGSAVGVVVGEGPEGGDLRSKRRQTSPEGLRRTDPGKGAYLLTVQTGERQSATRRCLHKLPRPVDTAERG